MVLFLAAKVVLQLVAKMRAKCINRRHHKFKFAYFILCSIYFIRISKAELNDESSYKEFSAGVGGEYFFSFYYIFKKICRSNHILTKNKKAIFL